MRFLYNNLPVIYVAFVSAVLSWAYGGTRSDSMLTFIPWLVAFMVEIFFFFPQKHPNESTFDARERVWSKMRKDPLVWTSFGLLVLLAIPFANNGLCPQCDAGQIAQGISPEPAVPILPFCVNRMHHLNVWLWFAAALSSAIAVRHCLVAAGKRLLVEMLVWNGFALAILGFVQIATKAPGPLWQEMANVQKAGDFFSTWGYPNMAGDYFTTLFGLSVALWRQRLTDIDAETSESHAGVEKSWHKMFWRRHFHLIPASVFYFAALNTLSRAAIILVTSLLVVYFAHAFISLTHRMSRARRLKTAVFWALTLICVIFFASVSLPSDLQREVDSLNTEVVLDRVTGRGQYHARVATELWKEHLLFGCGGWGYKHFCLSKMTEDDIKNIQMVGGINVHNDYLQFLAEHGLVGFGGMVAIVVMLLMPVASTWKRLAKAARFAKGKDRPAKPVQLFCLPAPVFCILMTTLATLVHSFGDCAMRCASVLSLFFIALAVMPGFLPYLEPTDK